MSTLTLVEGNPDTYVANPAYQLKNNTTNTSITTSVIATPDGNFTVIERTRGGDAYRDSGISDGGLGQNLPGGDRVVYTYDAQSNTYTFNTKDGYKLSDYSGSSLDNVNSDIKESLYTTIPPNAATALATLSGYQSIANSNQARQPIVDPTAGQSLSQATGVPQGSQTGLGDLTSAPFTGEITPKASLEMAPAEGLRYPSEIQSGQDRIHFQACTISARTGQQVTTFDSTFNLGKFQYEKAKSGPVILAIQSPIGDQNSVDWGPNTLTAIDAAIYNVSYKFIKDGQTPDFTGLTKEIAGLAPRLQRALAGQAAGVNNILARTDGVVLNPNLELLFQAPQLRPFTFQFKMSARHSDEAKHIKRIINYFKYHMAVRKEGGLFLKAPHVFWINYYKGKKGEQVESPSELHPGINRISNKEEKACALTNFSVDYTPLGSYMTYEDGTMVSYTLNLQFQELTPVYDDDYTNFQSSNANAPIGY